MRLLMGFLPMATALRVHVQPAARAMSTLRSASGVHRAAHRLAHMAAGFNDPDVTPDFVQKELEATWERAGKGRELWKPGDKTDSPLSDARLLFTTWKLNPLQLHIYDHCPFCLRARLVLGWLQARGRSEPHHSMARCIGHTSTARPHAIAPRLSTSPASAVDAIPRRDIRAPPEYPAPPQSCLRRTLTTHSLPNPQTPDPAYVCRLRLRRGR